MLLTKQVITWIAETVAPLSIIAVISTGSFCCTSDTLTCMVNFGLHLCSPIIELFFIIGLDPGLMSFARGFWFFPSFPEPALLLLQQTSILGTCPLSFCFTSE